MDRNEVYEACKVHIRPLNPERESGYIKTLLPKDAIDAIIDCAVQEANELMWKQLNDLAERYEAIQKGGDAGMSKLEIAKKIIKEQYNEADCGIYNSRNMAGDKMYTIYDDGELQIDVCYRYSYFEVFGLSCAEFRELKLFYNGLTKNEVQG